MITLLLQHLQDAHIISPLLVQGGPSTGKTAIIRSVLRELGRPHAYVSCVEHSKPGALLQAALNQLRGKRRRAEDNYGGVLKAEQVSDFLAQLSGLAPSGGPVHYIVVDHAQRLAGSALPGILLRLHELSGASASVILVSHVTWGSMAFAHGTMDAPRPYQISFPGYSLAELTSILALVAPNGADVRDFAAYLKGCILPMFARSSSRIEDLQVLALALYADYRAPARAADAAEARRLQAAFAARVRSMHARFEEGALFQGASAPGAALDTEAALVADRAGEVAAQRLDFELPFTGKVLLLAAYVCSCNRPALDRRLFDAISRAGRRRGSMAADRQAEAAKEARLRGPQAFPLERLLAVYWPLLRTHLDVPPPAAAEQSAEVLMQLTTLVSLRLLSRVSADPLDEPRFACNIPEALARLLAANIGLDLSTYLLYA
ncbi:hypothetical protein WJX81_002658 [Elliptochloris bilobata]|uniref:Origin recognition complex subunit 5 n=1 Tax=Elliptochloris bilobata TaxID=381761 RepID=A0AAW1RT30_9CHLO